ncbi:MAG TPA: hypothetical protein VFS15_24185, partial [Kofleriaceae bacterium]|nr:hypothetical protein [Kofleriaceae bacterium]
MVRTFDTLPEVTLARDLLRRWYGLELGYAAGDGSGYERTSHATCETLRALPEGACGKAMKDVAAALAAKKDAGAIVQRCHAQLTIVAAPVRDTGGLAGIVYASGGRTAAAGEVEAAIAGATGAADEAAALAARAPELGEADLARVRDLVASAAAAVERAQP